MIRLRILDILAEQNHTKYWLFKRMEMSYQNFNKIVNNETSSIRFDNLEKITFYFNYFLCIKNKSMARTFSILADYFNSFILSIPHETTFHLQYYLHIVLHM